MKGAIAKVLCSFVLLLAPLSAQQGKEDPVNSQECKNLTRSIKLMAKGTEINLQNLEELVTRYRQEHNRTRRLQTRVYLDAMNTQTAKRAADSQYPQLRAKLAESFLVNCGTLSAEINATIDGMIERSKRFNRLLAETLGDELSLSKIDKKGKK